MTAPTTLIGLRPAYRRRMVATVVAVAALCVAFVASSAVPASAEGDPMGQSNVTPSDIAASWSGVRGAQTWYTYVKPGETYEGLIDGRQTIESSMPSATIRWVLPDGTPSADCTITSSNPAKNCTYSYTLPADGTAGVVAMVIDRSTRPVARTIAAISVRLKWQIAVTENGTEQTGRTWTEELVLHDRTDASPSYGNLDLYYVTPQGFQYRVTRYGVQGIDSIYSGDAYGNVDKDLCIPAERTVAFPKSLNASSDPRYISGAESACQVTPFKQFFGKPDPTMPATVAVPTVPGQDQARAAYQTWLLPAVVYPTITAVQFTPAAPGARSGTISVNAQDIEGQLTIRVDVDNDGSFEGTADRSLTLQARNDQTVTWEFDGKDAQGGAISPAVPLAIRAVIDRAGEAHFVEQDVEMLYGGIQVFRVDAQAPTTDAVQVYWNDEWVAQTQNDRQAPYKCGYGPMWSISTPDSPQDSRGHFWGGGTSATVSNPCSLNGNATNAFNVQPDQTGRGGTFGNNRSVDLWAYEDVDISATIEVPGYTVTKASTPVTGSVVPGGSSIDYRIDVAPVQYSDRSQIPLLAAAATWTGRVADDLTKVRDDAMVALTDLAATPVAGSSFTTPASGWIWTGTDIPISSTVTITYRAEVQHAQTGDGSIDNIVFVSPTGDTPVPPTTCVPLLCAETHHELGVPAWTVEKTAGVGAALADRELVSPGETITYTVTATGTAHTVFDAVLTDTLTDVLTHATFVTGSATLTVGTGTPATLPDPAGGVIETPRFNLTAGQTAVLTYKVVVNEDAWLATMRNVVVGDGIVPPDTCAVGADADPIHCETTHNTPPVILIQKLGESNTGEWVGMDGSTWAIHADENGQPAPIQSAFDFVPVDDVTGRVAVPGIPAGDYWLVETTAPAGFTLLAMAIGFTVSPAGVVTLRDPAETAAAVSIDTASGMSVISVKDATQIELPIAGGIGAMPFTLGGGLILALTLSIVLLRRRFSPPLPVSIDQR